MSLKNPCVVKMVADLRNCNDLRKSSFDKCKKPAASFFRGIIRKVFKLVPSDEECNKESTRDFENCIRQNVKFC